MEIKSIAVKEQILNTCVSVLKKEFVGIDNVIDQVMNNIKSWYIFPNLMERPLIINLWGLTGCGKTSLVNRICDLLDLRNEMVYYNLAKLGEDDSSDLENNFNRLLGYSKKNPVFVFDEFQFAASIDSTGKEKECKTSLKTIWEIIDTGKLYREANDYTKRTFKRISRAINIMDSFDAKIENGVWVNSKECVDRMSVEQKTEVISLFNVNFDVGELYQELLPGRYWCDTIETSIANNKNFFASAEVTGLLFDCSFSLGWHNNIYADYFSQTISKMSLSDLHDYVVKVMKAISKGYVSDYSKSLVFVMGNIDEAYTLSYDMNPDMDPDQFRVITEKFTAIEIREALQERFRNEQIARLGSIHVLYPSFSKDNFESIIRLQLDNYAKSVKDEIDVDMHFDDSIMKMIYNDGVFPTQGTRPVFTSIYEIAKTKLASVVTECINNKIYDISDIYLSAEGDNVIANIYDKEKLLYTAKYKQNLRIDNLRNNVKKEQQNLTAVHESGHFVLYSKYTGKIPAKLVSATASSDANGFMLKNTEDDEKYMTYEDCIHHICIDLAGYVAETMVFGYANLTSGAYTDLKNATAMASHVVRDYGMIGGVVDKAAIVTTYLRDPMSTDGGMVLSESDYELEETNRQIKNIINVCMDDVKETLDSDEWHGMFLKSCDYLRKHTNMPKEAMTEIYESVDPEERNKYTRSENYFSDSLDKYLNK